MFLLLAGMDLIHLNGNCPATTTTQQLSTAQRVVDLHGQPSACPRLKPNYIAWNIWKERCRTLFGNKDMNVPQLVLLIKQDIHNWYMAYDRWEE